MQTALDGIQASALRADLQFIASDQLAGRDTPSPGLDRAADYIADQFRRAGLEPGDNGSYFQSAPMLVEEPDFTAFELELASPNGQFTGTRAETALLAPEALDLKNAPLLKLDLRNNEQMEHLTASEVAGKAVIAEIDSKLIRRLNSLRAILNSGKPAALILVDEKGSTAGYQRPRRLVDPSQPEGNKRGMRIILTGATAARFYAALKAGENNSATIHIAAPHRTPATLRNVVGMLSGSDPALRDSYVLLTAHYDHLGVKPAGTEHRIDEDRIYNGANDDGSGTVSVIEVARAMAHLAQHPRRSIVFMTFFGEEEGLIGSEYYVHHPIWPLAQTVADLNLEQVGRTDSTLGPEISNATLTGFDYSDLTGFVEDAGKRTGVKVYKNAQGSDDYFRLSDNFSFAEAGVPAETLTVAFDFPDYHAVGDEWQKIDYGNMAKVDRAVALAMFLAADSARPLRWNDENPKTAPYIRALEKRELK